MLERPPIGQFVHIEKTAGTSIRSSLERAIGPQYVYIFSPEADRFARSSDNLMPATTPILDRVRQGFSNPILGPVFVHIWAPMLNGMYRDRIRQRYPVLEVPEDTKVILGHFTASQFNDKLKNRQPILATVIRDPLARAKSHFEHWRRNRGFEDWRTYIPFDRHTTFKEFIQLPQLQNFQTQALADVALSGFDVVGITEKTDQFIADFLRVLQEAEIVLENRNPKQITLNVNHHRSIGDGEITPNLIGLFKELNKDDYALYEEAKELVSR